MESFSTKTKSQCLCGQSDLILTNYCFGLGRFKSKLSRGHLSHVFDIRCNAQQVSLKQVIQFEPTPVLQSVKAFAPATIANLGPGFDFLGCAVEGLGDHVSAEVNEDVEPGKIVISFIDGDNN